MDSLDKIISQKYVYTGERLKSYFQCHGISYKQAAEDLHIDKNTVGKAVRGGNLNIDIILRICNVYRLKITDFFKLVNVCETADGETYYLSSNEVASAGNTVAEENSEYKKCEKSTLMFDALVELMKDSSQKLDALLEVYRQCQDSLNAMTGKQETDV